MGSAFIMEEAPAFIFPIIIKRTNDSCEELCTLATVISLETELTYRLLKTSYISKNRSELHIWLI